jgi:GT2 family glycosyltransferase
MAENSENVKLACLLTCHSRREKTVACIAALLSCRLPQNVQLHIVLVDDGSRDGTSEAVRARFPQVELIAGDGTLFWNGGMRRAFAAAMVQDFDHYLWLNDDTTLDIDALERLYQCQETLSAMGDTKSNIIVGATRDPVTGHLSYGGLVAKSPSSPNYLIALPVGTSPQRCRTLNGNCVLIPRRVAQTLGNLDERFVHAIGDWDYGLRASSAGFGVWMAPGFVGTCERNPPHQFAPNVACSVRARLRFVCSPKQVPPRAWFVYVRRNYGPTWPLEFVKPYGSAVIGALATKWRMAVFGRSQ